MGKVCEQSGRKVMYGYVLRASGEEWEKLCLLGVTARVERRGEKEVSETD